MRRIGYIRTSTDKQLIDRQVLGLERYCDEVRIEDGVSAVKKARPVFEALKEELGDGDVFVVWAIDRAFRSTLDALLELQKFDARGVRFHSITQDIDTRTPEGRKWFAYAAADAEYERHVISARTKQGLAAARARGVQLGRPRKSVDLSEWFNSDEPPTSVDIAMIADRFGVSARTVRRRFQEREGASANQGRDIPPP